MFNREDYEYLLADIQDYARTCREQVKLTVLDKLGRIAGLLLLCLTVILIVFAVVAVGSVALISALSDCMPVWAASLVVAAVWLLLLVLVVSLRKQLFLNPMLTAIAAILFTGQPKRRITADSLEQQNEILAYKAGEQEKVIRRDAERIRRNWTGFFGQVAAVRSMIGKLTSRIFRR